MGVFDKNNEVDEEVKEKKGFFKRLKEGLSKTRNNIAESFNNLFKASELDDDFYDELEETLVMSDMGFETTERIIDDLKAKVKELKIKEAEACKDLVINIIRDQMSVDESAYDFEKKKTVVFVIGVNGVGKTTSIGKLAAQYKAQGKKVLMAAADTFRAAAIDQLKTWSNRAGVDIIAQNEGADPSAVVYDAVAAAKARNTDILLVDTAGRLHNKKNLMDELSKMRRIIDKEYPDANVESLIVLDGTTGQNALEQARQFSSVTEINGIIITKLDGTAKGGIAIAIQSELNVPVKYIGIGEKIEDLQKFDPNSYVTALFSDFELHSDIEMIIDANISEIKPDDDLFDI
ncbi:MAG: signal recognition particle-docking protein FtsY [Lachnospiraceae bacterium]|nr:signal recognition particle-docking protein FtsY [Lachnospiraceae bacterium]